MLPEGIAAEYPDLEIEDDDLDDSYVENYFWLELELRPIWRRPCSADPAPALRHQDPGAGRIQPAREADQGGVLWALLGAKRPVYAD